MPIVMPCIRDGSRTGVKPIWSSRAHWLVCGQRNGLPNPGISWFWRRVMVNDVKQSAIDPASGILPPAVLRNGYIGRTTQVIDQTGMSVAA